ncbi:cyanophycinase [Fuerstiella marisgermanici]|uniref:Cyanophycinase n=1 Tax=Fuerstiella marisgermanici TaxID=1891926 RepID=A0A1P8WCK7_9PLAN|nr:cyanophycinase [Fuerstiella marisgermanici]APZ91783.1 Cyanophycinase [Fuerstiella marisgermanici]
MRHLSISLILLFCVTGQTRGQVFDERYTDWPERTFISGTIVVAPSLDDPSLLQPVLPDPTADTSAALVTQGDVSPKWLAEVQSLFKEDQLSLHPLVPDTLQHVDILILCTRAPAADVTAQDVTKLHAKLQEFLDHNGTLVLVGPDCVSAGSQASGMKLIPDAILQLATDDPESDLQQLRTALSGQPRQFGISLSRQAVLILKGRKFRVVGDGSATFMVPGNGDWLPERIQILKQQTSRRQDPNEYLVDLTEWRREAIERTLEQFPPATPPTPHVENGTLVIVGGGGMPEGLMERFVELAGGYDNAKLVYIPCAEEPRVSPRQRTVEEWKKMGVQHATFLHTKDRHKANTDEEFLKPLTDATGIWFGGGRQWNMADSYYGTKAHRLMKQVLQRGGVIGGSSAGASIQARYLARATPILNFRIMAPGYERGGLGFIGGVAIDQHFSQRNRQADMSVLVQRYPQLLGIGIDESTALIVNKSVGDIVGDGQVYFYDHQKPTNGDNTDYEAFPVGSSYDLATRTVIVDATNKSE